MDKKENCYLEIPRDFQRYQIFYSNEESGPSKTTDFLLLCVKIRGPTMVDQKLLTFSLV